MWKVFARPVDFRLLTGLDALTEYKFGSRVIAHKFCSHCGVRPFASASMEQMGVAFYAINVACLDDATPQELAEAPVRYEDGRHDAWDKAPEETRYL